MREHRYLRPSYLCRTVRDVPYDELIKGGVGLIMFDVDNTLTTQGEKRLDEHTRDLLERLVDRDVEVALASNSRRDLSSMALSFGGLIHQPGHGVPRKPNPRYWTMFLERMGYRPDQAAMIGDKYFFDANPPLHLGMQTVLVNPIAGDLIGDALMGIRYWERLALAHVGASRPE